MRSTIFKVFALAALMGGSINAYAEDVMRVYTTDDSSVFESLDKIAKITFGESGFTIITPSGAVELPYAEVQSIKFDLGVSGLQNLTTDKNLKVSYANSCLNVAGADGAFDVAIFSINGSLVMADPTCADTSIDVSGLNNGVYIAKINNVVVKFIKN